MSKEPGSHPGNAFNSYIDVYNHDLHASSIYLVFSKTRDSNQRGELQQRFYLSHEAEIWHDSPNYTIYFMTGPMTTGGHYSSALHSKAATKTFHQ